MKDETVLIFHPDKTISLFGLQGLISPSKAGDSRENCLRVAKPTVLALFPAAGNRFLPGLDCLDHPSMETISLFTPDVFLIVVLMTILGAGWALTRTYLTFRPTQG